MLFIGPSSADAGATTTRPWHADAVVPRPPACAGRRRLEHRGRACVHRVEGQSESGASGCEDEPALHAVGGAEFTREQAAEGTAGDAAGDRADADAAKTRSRASGPVTAICSGPIRTTRPATDPPDRVSMVTWSPVFRRNGRSSNLVTSWAAIAAWPASSSIAALVARNSRASTTRRMTTATSALLGCQSRAKPRDRNRRSGCRKLAPRPLRT
jgi:hypothetical protein